MRHSHSNLSFSLEMRSICKRKNKTKLCGEKKDRRNSSNPRWCYASCQGELGDLIRCCCWCCCYHAKLQVARGNWNYAKQQQQCRSVFCFSPQMCWSVPTVRQLVSVLCAEPLSSSLHCPTHAHRHTLIHREFVTRVVHMCVKLAWVIRGDAFWVCWGWLHVTCPSCRQS